MKILLLPILSFVILASLIATCEANAVNPVDYFADVLLRLQTHPASRIDELLPHNWTPPRPEPST